jgi:CHAD domain-containing protein
MSDHDIEVQDDNEQADKNIISSTLIEPLISNLNLSAGDIIETSSAEGLHLLRVTLRKIRAWIGVSKIQLSEPQIEEVRGHVRWLSAITGPARDADVQLAKSLQAEIQLPKSAKEKLKKQQQDCYQHIATELKSERFSKFIALLTAISAEINVDDQLTVEHIYSRLIKLVKRSLKQGDELHVGSEDEAFHEVRKLLKKLRYTLGFLMQLAPEKRLAKTEKSLKLIQEYLGTFQDQTVLAKELDQKASELMQTSEPDQQELFALGVSTGETRSHIQSLKSGFLQAYRKFSKAVTKNLLSE